MNLEKSNHAPRRGLHLAALLLVAVSLGAYLPTTRTADATPAVVPAPSVAMAAPTPVAEPIPAAVPAVTSSPAETVFAQKEIQGLSPEVLEMALDAVSCARSRGVSGRDDLLTVIDYSLPSTEPRLWVLDLERGEVLFHELVAHGSGTGENQATRFSNVVDSRQTSLGLFLTGGTYEGGNGYSLKLKGLDEGFNDRAEQRHIVMHGAPYVSAENARRQGRLGRSWGCPALSLESARSVIDTVKGGSFIFSYSAADPSWLRASSSLQSCGAAGGSVQTALAK